jgi:HAD superfamily phosphatase (TIGR01668 family)
MIELAPTLCLPSVAYLQPEMLLNEMPNIKAVTFDLDKTLTGQHELIVPDEHVEALARLNEADLLLGIISNAPDLFRTTRARTIASDISERIGADIKVVTSYMVDGEKKPYRTPYDRMSKELMVPNGKICYVGDQLFKDILGATNAGYAGSVLVQPYGGGDDPRVKYLQRPIEALVRPMLGLPLRTKNFGRQQLVLNS